MCLSHGGNGSNRGSGNVAQVDLRGDLATRGGLLGAVSRDVASLSALVAGLASSVKRTSVRSSAVTRDVAKLSARVALHSLGLAISGKVVGTTALVASSGTGSTTETTSAVATGESTTGHGAATAHGGTDGVGASTLYVCQSDT